MVKSKWKQAAASDVPDGSIVGHTHKAAKRIEWCESTVIRKREYNRSIAMDMGCGRVLLFNPDQSIRHQPPERTAT